MQTIKRLPIVHLTAQWANLISADRPSPSYILNRASWFNKHKMHKNNAQKQLNAFSYLLAAAGRSSQTA
jgi:hypothetical protein